MARSARSRAKPSRNRSPGSRSRKAQPSRQGARRKSAAPRANELRERRRPARSRPSRRTTGPSMRGRPEATAELDFERGDERSGRAGDLRSRSETRERFPPSRGREAGRTGGEAEERDRITPDDASPETLVDRESLQGLNTPVEGRHAPSADASLSEVDESAIGAGGGRDEAENANREGIEAAELKRIRRRVARSGGSLRNVEPAETAAGSPGRERNRDARDGGSKE